MLLSIRLLLLPLCVRFTHCHPVKVTFEDNPAYSGNVSSTEGSDLPVSAVIERVNKNLGQALDEPLVMFGDIAMPTGFTNADPCTANTCKWVKDKDGMVYVPYEISNQYSPQERRVIETSLISFHQLTCVHFRPRSSERDYISIRSLSGCYSFIGRTGGAQILSLSRHGCVHHHIVQHEILHALGFHHEQSRSDRDRHIRILFQNIIPGHDQNFMEVDTNNLDTPYDYNSVMQYTRDAFSKNGEPTMVPVPDPAVPIGLARAMSSNDVLRVKRLYNC